MDVESTRAVSPIIGLVLLIGAVAIGSIAILIIGGAAISEIQQETEADRVEQAFVELSQNMGSATTNSDTTYEMNLEAGEDGAIARDDTGWITIESDDLAEPINHSFGTIEYVGDDGTHIAYEAGGVFRETGDETRVISSPPISYQDDTVSLPVTTMTGDENLGTGDIKLENSGIQTYSGSAAVEDHHVTITVQSDYYRGWERFFENQAGSAVIESVDHDDRTVTARFGHLELEDAFGSGLTVSEIINEDGNPDFDDSDYDLEEGTFAEMDDTIDEMEGRINTTENRSWASNPEDGPWTIDGEENPETFEEGTYFADGVSLNGSGDEATFDLADGNITLFVDGDLEIDHTGARFVAENWSDDNALKIYTTGDLYVGNGEVGAEEQAGGAHSERFQLFGTSESAVGFEDGSYMGTIYVASSEFDAENDAGSDHCDHQVCFHSNPSFTGSIIAASANLQGGGGSLDFEYDAGLGDSEIDVFPDGYTPPPQVTYLNTAHYEVTVTNN